MKLIIVRHARAGDRTEFAKTGQPDELRPLSPAGRKQMRSAATGLRAIVPTCDLILTSPYTRARQTAEILAGKLKAKIQETATLEPDNPPSNFLECISGLARSDVIIAVGHEPHLGCLATWLISGVEDSAIDFRKGGACLIDFAGTVGAGAGTLRWLMGPKELAILS